MIVGRSGGKSRTLALIAVYLACFRDYGPHLAAASGDDRGAGGRQGAGGAIFRFVLGLLKAVPMLKPLIVRRDSETIELSNRVHVEIATASFRSTRGYSYAAVLADEVAFWRSDETYLNPDVEILRALRPGLATIPGAVADGIEPYAKRVRFTARFRLRFGRDDVARVLVWKASTRGMMPSVDKTSSRGVRERSGKREGAVWLGLQKNPLAHDELRVDGGFRDDAQDRFVSCRCAGRDLWPLSVIHRLAPSEIVDSRDRRISDLNADLLHSRCVAQGRPPFDLRLAGRAVRRPVLPL